MSKLIYLTIISILIIGILSYVALNLYLMNRELNEEIRNTINKYEILRSRVKSLQSTLSNLNSSYQSLQKDYKELESEYRDLLNKYNNTIRNFNELRTKCKDLVEKYNSIVLKYSELESEHQELQILYNESVEKLHNLQKDYQELKHNYDELSLKYFKLETKYQELILNYSKLKIAFEKLKSFNKTFISSYNAWRSFATSYTYLNNETIRRVFSHKELESLKSTVNDVLTNPSDFWNSIEELYRFVDVNIFYSNDPPIPLPPTFDELLIGTFINRTRNELIQSPSETLTRREGDCEDQAILLYALMKSYFINILKEDHVMWLMLIRMGNGQGHVAVAFPSKDGKLTILDPAGHYYTKDLLRKLTSNDPFEELAKYSDLWSLYGGIKWIWLLKVDIDKGIFNVEAEGDIDTIAKYIATNYK